MSTTPNYEIPGEMRDFAEKSVDQARKAFDSFMGAARRTSDTVQGSAELARNNTLNASSRGFEYAEQNVNAAFDFAKRLVRARDVQEAMQLQADFVRSQFAAMQSQAKEFSGIAQSAMQEGAERAKSAMQQGADEARKAMEQGRDVAHQTAENAQDAVNRSTNN
jgi:phasin